MKQTYLKLYWPSRRFLLGVLRSLNWFLPGFSRFRGRRLQRRNLNELKDAFIEVPLLRAGSKYDGGYLIPHFARGEIDALFSPGVAANASFEMHFAEQGVNCYLVDGSINRTPEIHENIFFEKAWLSANKIDSQKHLTLVEWISSSGYAESRSLGLQMDIEGSEWAIFQSTDSEVLKQFKFITVEFHWLQASSKYQAALVVEDCIKKLLETHSPVWIHPNNGDFAIPLWGSVRYPPLLETTFLRNDLLTLKGQESDDVKNFRRVGQVNNDQRFVSLRGVSWLQKDSKR